MNNIRPLARVVAVALVAGFSIAAVAATAVRWKVPEIGALPKNRYGMQVREGRDLVAATYAFIGPNVADPGKRFAGNNLACSNCHLQAGTKKFGLPLFGLFGDFPKYSARSGTEIDIEDRINACMTRSMNGRKLDKRSPQMTAIVSYIKFLSTGVIVGEAIAGMGTGNMPELDRAADPIHGKSVYTNSCAACHGANGSGISNGSPSQGYAVPPLWGADSFNDGAGMARLITVANFVHFNMPHGTDYLDPQLSTEEAWDVGAFVISQPRPKKAGLEEDFPDLLMKPIDASYGPYADKFTQTQHTYGPFAPIRLAIENMRAKRGGAQ